MRRRPEALTLAQRTELTKRAAARREGRETPGRHCYVVDPPGGYGRVPALLLDWRREGEQWLGHVVYVGQVEGIRVVLKAWLPAEQLRDAAAPGDG
jgi:hypothetical protein